MSYDELSHPPTKPFEARMRDLLRSGQSAAHPEAAYTVHEYVLLAKLMLIEHRVRDFSASDVVALAKIMEARDRQLRYTVIVGDDK
jgi:hypothetical protein